MFISKAQALRELEDLRAPSLSITRIFKHAPDSVFDAWITPALAKLWWAPRGLATSHMQQDVRVGGNWRFSLACGNGKATVWEAGEYLEIVKPHRLVMTHAWEMSGARGDESTLSVQFSSHRGNTLIALKQGILPSVEIRDAHYLAWNEAFDRLQTCLDNPFRAARSLQLPVHHSMHI